MVKFQHQLRFIQKGVSLKKSKLHTIVAISVLLTIIPFPSVSAINNRLPAEPISLDQTLEPSGVGTGEPWTPENSGTRRDLEVSDRYKETYPDNLAEGVPPMPEFPQGELGTTSDMPIGRNAEGLYYVNVDEFQTENSLSDSSIQDIQGPDQYGYTWEESYPYDWKDVSAGEDTGITNNMRSAGPFNIGFDFDFYSNTYTQLYISAYGYISFNYENLGKSQSDIPDQAIPNDVIAPFWGPMDTIGYVKYATLGEAPNRQMVIEWNQQGADDDVYTFEAILHENGDIVYQYNQILVNGDSFYCTSTGIEDQFGIDHLPIRKLCRGFRFTSEEALRIYRPTPSARISLLPVKQSSFGSTFERTYSVTLSNFGDFGADTYNLQLDSTWQATLFHSDGISALTDTNGDGLVDTGLIPEKSSKVVLIRITPPSGVGSGDSSDTTITATSSVDPSQVKTSLISLVIPAPFAQSVSSWDKGGGVYLAHPVTQIESFGYGSSNVSGIVETASGYLGRADLGWKYDAVSDSYYNALRANIHNGYGRILSASYLSEFTPSVNYVGEVDPALAAAPNGNIGIVWYRWERAQDGSQLFNVLFAIIDESGNIVFGPQNITGNSTWGYWGDENFKQFTRPQVAVTEDGNFAIAFQQSTKELGTYYTDVFFGVRDSAGNVVSELTNITRDPAEINTNFSEPVLIDLSGNRFLLVWYSYNGITAQVFNSAGEVLKPKFTIVGFFNLGDAIQLSDGKIILVGTNWSEDSEQVYYTILADTTFEPSTPRTLLNNPNSQNNSNISVTKGEDDQAILTWLDNVAGTFYYALVDSQGLVLTEPFAFLENLGLGVDVSSTGYGNTTYSQDFIPFTSCDAVSTIPVSECLALQAFYEKTNGAQWENNSGWFEFSDPASWHGVYVEEDQVVSLDFFNNNLSGTIPSELSTFTSLKTLGLAQNKLTGSIPETLGDLTSLEYMDLSQNKLTGSIPATLGGLSSLGALYLEANELTGEIPPELGTLSNLRYLGIAQNQLSGGIPASLGDLINLEYLDLSMNPLSGSIPASLGDLSNLRYLYLFSCNLSGEIPVELGKLVNLKYFDLAHNGLSGSIPSELGDLVSLRILWLNSNHLTGEIPSTLSNLANLEQLDLRWNQLTGTIPAGLGDLSNLFRLFLEKNDLTGSIPSEFGNLTKLTVLDLSDNRLSGDVPDTLTNLVNLCESGTPGCYPYGLDLSYNYLNVPAPEPLASFLAIKDPDWYLTQAVEEDIPGETGGTVVSNDGNTQIDIPADAVEGLLTILFAPQPWPSQNIGVLTFSGNSFELTAFNEFGAVDSFAQPVTLTLQYDQASLGVIPEDSLILYYWDTIELAWLDAATTCESGSYTRNLEEDWLSLPICHLSEFALLGGSFDLFLPAITR